jgi:hypothetical protein
MSNLRVVGIILGLLGLVSTFLVFRGSKWKRANFIFFSLFNISLIVVSANPDAVNFLRDMLSLQKSQRGRLMALLVFSNIFLLFFSFYSRIKVENLRLQFDRLVRSMGVDTLEKAVAFKGRIKPVMVVIPALNEAANLRDLLTQIPANVCGLPVGVLVVDDGSDDDTRQVVNHSGHLVVSTPINRGGGAALRLGYDILKRSGGKICVTMDADGQHKPEELEHLVSPLCNDQFDFIIGSRILGGREKDSMVRLAGVYTFGWLISILLGQKITDPSSGYRAFNMAIMESIHLYEDQYHTSELIIEAVRNKIRIGEVPVTILKRRHGKSKKGRDWKYALNFTNAVVKTWWR